MRLTEFEIEAIKSLAILHFGEKVKVYLFGSRVSDDKRGGDIDLFISSSEKSRLRARTKINFLTDLMFKIGERKVDVVLDHPARKETEFLKTIYRTAVQL